VQKSFQNPSQFLIHFADEIKTVTDVNYWELKAKEHQGIVEWVKLAATHNRPK
jgi:hypothetical protein